MVRNSNPRRAIGSCNPTKPRSSLPSSSARDSFLMALFTCGEGYHNYHHEFQHDYRNGVKPWEWDPTKWLIWTLSKVGLTKALRRVPQDAIYSAQARLRDLQKAKSHAHLAGQ